ncbi:hypothetical protein RIR_e42144_A0A2I1FAC4_9GLOM [Rhizophagus irregularis DAOM 181602=DAOM 197198]|nr:hypothetical protein RIR_e42144_A0A2I1FAC4_9GLOM [Rhizophagus irregularis DAOM 181602=DAOM 197198]
MITWGWKIIISLFCPCMICMIVKFFFLITVYSISFQLYFFVIFFCYNFFFISCIFIFFYLVVFLL